MALVRFSTARDLVVGYLKAFGDNSAYIPAVTIVDSGGADATGPTSAQVGSLTETAPATDTASSGLNGRLQRIAQRVTSLIALLPASLGTKTGAASLAVTLASDDLRSATAAFTSVNSANASTNILALNAARKGAVIVNTAANILYLDLTGGTAAVTRYAAALATGEEYQVPFGYSGLITGIWAADGAGAALVTEFS
jgi:hypothetical protein